MSNIIEPRPERSICQVLILPRESQKSQRRETAAQPGVQRTWLESWFPLKDASGQIAGINVVAVEITDRKQMEEALRKKIWQKCLEVMDKRLRESLANIIDLHANSWKDI